MTEQKTGSPYRIAGKVQDSSSERRASTLANIGYKIQEILDRRLTREEIMLARSHGTRDLSGNIMEQYRTLENGNIQVARNVFGGSRGEGLVDIREAYYVEWSVYTPEGLLKERKTYYDPTWTKNWAGPRIVYDPPGRLIGRREKY